MEGIKYEISYEKPHRHFVDFKAQFPVLGRSEMELSLSLWRPGRYEAANYASKVRSISFSNQGSSLSSVKPKTNSWKIECAGLEYVEVSYSFYADHFDAGGCWLDDEQLYLNPVNCILFDVQHQNLAYEIKLDLPDGYQVASQLGHGDIHALQSPNFNELAEAPFICSKSLTHRTFESSGVLIHIWIQGDFLFDLDKFVEDHRLFAEEQIKDFGFFPSDDYHFLYHIPHVRAYHGVEHSRSTVISMGPSAKSGETKFYNDLIGIASHELYHTWNVKQLRPKVLTPYNYQEPRPSALGFIYEGVTTYLGDKYLWTTKVYDDEVYARELELKVLRHTHNPGRTALSLADSSVDTWVDGYILGTPWRKVSIYNEGALVSMIIDAKIHSLTEGKQGIEDWMRVLMQRCPLDKGGYDQDDLEATLLEVCGWSSSDFFRDYVYGTTDLVPLVNESLKELGWNLAIENNPKVHEDKFGFKMDKKNIVMAVFPDSAGEEMGLWLGDLVESVDEKELVYVRKSSGERKVLHLPLGSNTCYPIPKVSRI